MMVSRTLLIQVRVSAVITIYTRPQHAAPPPGASVGAMRRSSCHGRAGTTHLKREHTTASPDTNPGLQITVVSLPWLLLPGYGSLCCRGELWWRLAPEKPRPWVEQAVLEARISSSQHYVRNVRRVSGEFCRTAICAIVSTVAPLPALCAACSSKCPTHRTIIRGLTISPTTPNMTNHRPASKCWTGHCD